MLAGAAGHLRHFDGVLLGRRGPAHRARGAGHGRRGLARPGHRHAAALAADRTDARRDRLRRAGCVCRCSSLRTAGDPGTFLLFPYLQGPRDGGCRAPDALGPGEPVPGAVAGRGGRHRAGPVRRGPARHPGGRRPAGTARRRDRGAGDAPPARRRLGRGPPGHRGRLHRRRTARCASRGCTPTRSTSSAGRPVRRCPSSRRNCRRRPPGSSCGPSTTAVPREPSRRTRLLVRIALRGHRGAPPPTTCWRTC